MRGGSSCTRARCVSYNNKDVSAPRKTFLSNGTSIIDMIVALLNDNEVPRKQKCSGVSIVWLASGRRSRMRSEYAPSGQL